MKIPNTPTQLFPFPPSEAPSCLQLKHLTCPVGVTVVFREVQGTTFSKLLHFLCSHRTQSHSGISPYPMWHHIIQRTNLHCVYFMCSLYLKVEWMYEMDSGNSTCCIPKGVLINWVAVTVSLMVAQSNAAGGNDLKCVCVCVCLECGCMFCMCMPKADLMSS